MRDSEIVDFVEPNCVNQLSSSVTALLSKIRFCDCDNVKRLAAIHCFFVESVFIPETRKKLRGHLEFMNAVVHIKMLEHVILRKIKPYIF